LLVPGLRLLPTAPVPATVAPAAASPQQLFAVPTELRVIALSVAGAPWLQLGSAAASTISAPPPSVPSGAVSWVVQPQRSGPLGRPTRKNIAHRS
jgi:hypothetical protein